MIFITLGTDLFAHVRDGIKVRKGYKGSKMEIGAFVAHVQAKGLPPKETGLSDEAKTLITIYHDQGESTKTKIEIKPTAETVKTVEVEMVAESPETPSVLEAIEVSAEDPPKQPKPQNQNAKRRRRR